MNIHPHHASKQPRCSLWALAFLWALPCYGQLVVDQSGSGTHTTIQSAINAASDGFEIVVAPGVYFERIDFLGKAVQVISVAPLDAAIVAATVIDGGDGGHVVTFASGETPQTVLCGLTVRNGNAVHGGGIYCINGSSPVIQRNVIRENFCVLHGGGIHISSDSSPFVYANTITENVCEGRGGGIYAESSASVISANIFQSNRAGCSSGGGIHLDAGADAVLIENNLILENQSTFGGGAQIEHCSPSIVRNRFIANVGNPRGAAISFVDGGGIFESNVVAGNRSLIAAAAEFNNSDVLVRQNTFAGNWSEQSGAVLAINGSRVEMSGNIVAFQRGAVLQALAPSSIRFDHGCLFGNDGGDAAGNVTFGSGLVLSDPMLVNVGGWTPGGPLPGPICGGVVQLQASLAGAGSASGDASYRFGPDRVRFTVEIGGFSAGVYDVTAGGQLVGQITADSGGDGQLRFDTEDGTMPAGFPELAIGDAVSVSSVINGVLDSVAMTFDIVWSSGDEHLLPGSPCIDASTHGAVAIADVDGQPRQHGALPDIGADEATPAGAGDVDGDGDVDLADLAQLQRCLASPVFGLRSPTCVAVDINGDATITSTDWSLCSELVTGPR